MRKRPFILVPVAMAVLAVAVLAGAGSANPEAPGGQETQVFVLNFPATQKIEGVVGVAGTIAHARLVRIPHLVVPPVERGQTSDLIDAGKVETAGFTGAVLSLQGELRGTLSRPGAVGAILVPDDEDVVAMFDKGKIHFPLEVGSAITGKEVTTFTAESRSVVGFPGYRVFLYNETDRVVDVDLFVYLTN